MATSQVSSIALAIAATLTSPLNLGSGAHQVNYNPSFQLANGNGAGQASQMFADVRTLAASANESLDLAGSLLDAFGNTMTFAKIKAMIIAANAANTNDVLVGGAGANGFTTWVGDPTDIVKVKPGGLLVLVAPDANGYGVTAATGDLLKIANSSSGTGVTYTIILIGV